MTTKHKELLDSIEIGDRVWGTHSDNFGFEGVIIGKRDVAPDKLPYRFRLRFDYNGQEQWVADWEIQGKGEPPT